MLLETGSGSDFFSRVGTFVLKMQKQGLDELTANRLTKLLFLLKDNPNQLSQIDIHKAFNSETIAENVNTAFIRKSKLNLAILGLEILRNLLVLFPILLTWQSLSRASKAYLEVVSASPDLLERPFLLQWEEGFSNRLPTIFGYSLTFSNVALTDAVIVFVIIVLTFVVMTLHNYQMRRAASKTAQFITEFEDILWETDLLLGAYRIEHLQNSEAKSLELIQEIREFVNEFKTHSSELEKSISIEKDMFKTLSEERLKDVKALQSISVNLEQSSKNVVDFGQQLIKPVAAMQLTTNDFAIKIGDLVQVQQQLLRELTELQAHFSKFEAAISELGITQTRIASDLIEPARLNLQRSQETDASITSLVVSTRELDQTQKDLSNLLTEELTANDKWIASFHDSLSRIAVMVNAIQNLDASIKTLENITQSNSSIALGLQTIQKSNMDVASSLTSFTHNFSAIGGEIQNLQRLSSTVGTTLTEIISKLSNLSQSMSAMSTYAATVTNELRSSTAGAASIKQEIQRLADETKELRNLLSNAAENPDRNRPRGGFLGLFGR